MSWLDRFFPRPLSIQVAGALLPAEGALNFSSGFTVTDNAALGRTDIVASSLSITGTGFAFVSGSVIQGSAVTVNLASSTHIGTSKLGSANGGTGQDFSASSGLLKFTAGTASVVAAPSGAIVGDSDVQTLTNKTLTSPTLGGTITISGTSMQATGNARARAYSDIANVQTTDATVTSLYTWTILDQATTKACFEICATRSTMAEIASYVRQAAIKNNGGAITIVSTIDTPFTREENAAWDATIDNSGTTGRARVTGANSTTIDWGCIASRFEVTHA